jgi:Predicted drug exporters of the RND superfamily
MAGLFLTGDATFASFGYATIIVVAVAMLGSLTVLPALLSKLGDRVDRLHVPLVRRRRRSSREGGAWGGIVDAVLRRPLLSASLAGGLLIALAIPALQMHMATPGRTHSRRSWRWSRRTRACSRSSRERVAGQRRHQDVQRERSNSP